MAGRHSTRFSVPRLNPGAPIATWSAVGLQASMLSSESLETVTAAAALVRTEDVQVKKDRTLQIIVQLSETKVDRICCDSRTWFAQSRYRTKGFSQF